MRANPLTWAPRETEAPKPYVFQDGEHEITIWLRRRSLLTMMRQDDIAESLVQQYITGSETDPPMSFPAVGGEVVSISAALFRTIAGIVAIQDAPSELETYSPEEFVAIAARSEQMFQAMVSTAASLGGLAENQKKSGKGLMDGSPELASKSPVELPINSND